MAMDLKWILSADDKVTPVFDKLHKSGKEMADGVTGAFSGVLSKFNLVSGAVTGMAAIAAGGVFTGIIKETIAWTSEAVSLSKSLGIATDKASILNVALGDVYVSKDTMLAGSQRIAKALKTEEEAFHKLGVATRDQSGHYRSTLDIMTDVNSKLLTLREGTDRNVAGMAIYGKSWGEMSGLLKLNNEVMDEAAKKAEELGLIVGDEQVREMKKYKAAMNDLEDVTKSLALRFGNALLPNLVKVGAWLGKIGPGVAWLFDKSLKLLGKTIFTVGDWLGLMASRAVSMGSIIKSVFTGNFADARQEFRNMVAAGDDFSARTKANWLNWGNDPVKAKSIAGDHLDPDLLGSKAKEKEVKAVKDTSTEILKEYQSRAKEIIGIEENRIKDLIDREKGYLETFKREYEENIQQLDKFSAAMRDVHKAQTDRAQAAIDATRGAENPLEKMARLNAELSASEEDLNKSWADPAAKVKGLDDLIVKYRSVFQEIKDGETVIYSQSEADRDFRVAEDRLMESISRVADEMKTKEEATVDLAEKINIAEQRVKGWNAELKTLDLLLKGLPQVVNVDVNMRLNGMQDVNRAFGYQNFGDYYTMGGNTYWSDGSLAESGTSVAMPPLATGTNYVRKEGPYYLHRGEAVVPEKYNPAAGGSGSGGSVSFGDIIVNLAEGTPQQNARETARAIYRELEKLSGRKIFA